MGDFRALLSLVGLLPAGDVATVIAPVPVPAPVPTTTFTVGVVRVAGSGEALSVFETASNANGFVAMGPAAAVIGCPVAVAAVVG